MRQVVFRIKESKIYFSNTLFFDLFGIEEQHVQGKDYRQILSTHVSKEIADYFTTLIETRIVSGYKSVLVTGKDGVVLPLSVFGYFIDEENEEIMGTFIETTQLNEELLSSLGYLSLIQQALNQSVILAITDLSGKITYANEHFCEISGYESHELIGRTHKMLNSGEHSQMFFKELWETISSGAVWRGEIKNRKKDGTCYWADSTIVPMLDEEEQPFQYMAIRYDVTKQKRNEEHIEWLANVDSLTALPNRRLFDQTLVNCIENAQEEKKAQERFGLLFLDLDSFKYINDTQGHKMGDRLLVQVASRFQEIIGDKGLVARIGGDEFAIIIYSVADAQELKKIAQQLVKKLKAPFHVGNLKLRMTCSIGLALYPESGLTSDSLMKVADTEMYKVKKSRKNGFSFSEGALDFSNQRLFKIQNNLRDALFDEQFYLVYQPKVSPYQHRITGFEALIRWRHEDLGEVSPGEFIPVAEEIGMLNELNDWVLNKVCQQLNEWKAEGYALMPISINLSATQFMHEDFAEEFLETLRKYNIATRWIQIEITESTFLENTAQAQRLLDRMKFAGIKVALDDFGTGYSSLSYLINLNLDVLKIDKSLIKGISKNFQDKRVVETVIQLGKDLGLRVVAEGIENKEEFNLIARNGVDEIQGFYYSRPLSVHDTAQLLVERKIPR